MESLHWWLPGKTERTGQCCLFYPSLSPLLFLGWCFWVLNMYNQQLYLSLCFIPPVEAGRTDSQKQHSELIPWMYKTHSCWSGTFCLHDSLCYLPLRMWRREQKTILIIWQTYLREGTWQQPGLCSALVWTDNWLDLFDAWQARRCQLRQQSLFPTITIFFIGLMNITVLPHHHDIQKKVDNWKTIVGIPMLQLWSNGTERDICSIFAHDYDIIRGQLPTQKAFHSFFILVQDNKCTDLLHFSLAPIFL